MAKRNIEFSFNVNAAAITVNKIQTVSCFDSTYVENSHSPLDNCLIKIEQLNVIHTQALALYHQPNDSKMITVYNLVLLGYISAIESYIREIIRKTINLDKFSNLFCEAEEITYGAALTCSVELLPEVLLENASFASKENISKAFKQYLGLKGHQPNELLTTLEEFETICHLRHCIVHRFGKLGSKNAIKFGLDNHKELIEKPLKLDVNLVYELSMICTNTALVINKFLFNKTLERTAQKENNIWSWDLRKDKKLFKQYYDLFKSEKKPDGNSSLNKAYLKLKEFYYLQ